jgi:hypothetical protein
VAAATTARAPAPASHDERPVDADTARPSKGVEKAAHAGQAQEPSSAAPAAKTATPEKPPTSNGVENIAGPAQATSPPEPAAQLTGQVPSDGKEGTIATLPVLSTASVAQKAEEEKSRLGGPQTRAEAAETQVKQKRRIKRAARYPKRAVRRQAPVAAPSSGPFWSLFE